MWSAQVLINDLSSVEVMTGGDFLPTHCVGHLLWYLQGHCDSRLFHEDLGNSSLLPSQPTNSEWLMRLTNQQEWPKEVEEEEDYLVIALVP